MSVLLYRTNEGPVAVIDGLAYQVAPNDWDTLLNTAQLHEHLVRQTANRAPVIMPKTLLTPMVGQELWGAGVTYFRSRLARMEESKTTGGGSFYDRVYEADRPELFFKATAQRVSPPGGVLRLRRDSRWIVPEPELTLVINSQAKIIGYTIANDLSCRDIEAENPLYLPQAKIFDGCASIGPGLLIQEQPLSPVTRIQLEIQRDGISVSNGETTVSELKREFSLLVDYLTREASFPQGCFLMTGTGIVPDDSFTLRAGDRVHITIDGIGTLSNTMQ